MTMNGSTTVCSIGHALAFGAAAFAGEGGTRQTAHLFEKEITARLGYLLYLPKDYESQPDRKWPLVLFLHGAGERGDDLDQVKIHGIPKRIAEGEEFPFIAVSPQCPADSWWTAEEHALDALLDEIIATYAVDEDRVVLTGLSMGGYGAWALATAHPERFAALAPICGGGIPAKAARLKDIPIWVFHGAKDEVVKPEQSQAMVEALREVGADVRFTLYPEADHDSWTETYNNPEFYTWLLSQRRGGKK